MSRGCIEGTAIRILDARIQIQSRFLGSPRVVDALRTRKRVDVFVIEIEIARQRPQLRGLRNSAVRIFRGNLGQLQRRIQHAIDARAGKVARVGACRALAEEDPHPNRLRSRLFQSLYLPQTNHGREFVAFTNHGLGRSRPACHRPPHYVGGEFF